MPKTDISVRELVDKIRRGELALPEMQRKYVWPATRVRDLFDSLYRGYPTGTILVWETDKEVEERKLAIKPTNTPATTQRQLLLDGQQRLTSLAAILTGEPIHVKNHERPIEILFNLEHPEGPLEKVIEVDEADIPEETLESKDKETAEQDIQEELKKKIFVVYSKSLENNPVWILVSSVFKKTDSEILKSIGINSDDKRWDKYSNRLQKLRNIAGYQYVMQVLDKNKTYEEVTEIFVRVNSLGARLRSSDLALAQITSKWKGFMRLMENFAEDFDTDKKYIIESGLPVRLLVIFATHQSRFKTVSKLNKQRLEESWKLATNGVRFAVNFLRSNANIDDLSYISSSFLLIPIAVYAINNNEKISAEEEKKLLRWFYLAHIRGYYSSSSESTLDSDLSNLFKNNNLDSLIDELKRKVNKFVVDSDDITNRGEKSPFFSMLYFVLKQNGAKDWVSGLSLSEKHIGKSHALQYHHIFPKSLLEKQNYDKKEINEIANFAFIGSKTNKSITNKEPKDYFQDIIKERGESALTSQLVPLDEELWKISNYKRFLEFRRNAIANETNKFMSKFE